MKGKKSCRHYYSSLVVVFQIHPFMLSDILDWKLWVVVGIVAAVQTILN